MFAAQIGDDLVIGIRVDDLPSLEDVEWAYLEMVLDIHGGDKRAAAETLGVSLKTIYNKLAQIEARREFAEKGS
jgi:DNA-binding NtrC family response regulator